MDLAHASSAMLCACMRPEKAVLFGHLDIFRGILTLNVY